jgi:DMSO/TMAO reductase YedYZ molybdopterin-dependent catalytic subunit
MLPYLPPGFEAAAIGAMGGLAKIMGLIGAIMAFVGVHAAAAAYRGRIMERWGLSRSATMAAYTLAPALVMLLVLLPLFGGGVAGSDTPVGAFAATTTVLLGSFLYALVLDRATAWSAARHPQGMEISRRHFIVASASALAIVAMGIAGLGAFVTSTARQVFASYGDLVAGEVTPNSEFYKVQKNLVGPMVDPSTWELKVGGLVDRPRSYTNGELLDLWNDAQHRQDQFHTLECVSNYVGGGLIGNARWSGVPLRDLLEAAGVRGEATWVEFRSADNYDVGIPLHKAMQPGSLLALYMNGERLPSDHGYPVRALVPGLYGMMNPKWITEINLVDREVVGYWQRQGWTNEGTIRLTSIISVVPTAPKVGELSTLGGVAFAGDREVTRVEVSVDNGRTWDDAVLKGALDANAWNLWRYDWTPEQAGPVHIRVRAFERVGGVEVMQEEMRHAPFPDGATGFDQYDVTVAG